MKQKQVREVQGEITTKPYRWQANGLLALQEVRKKRRRQAGRQASDYMFLLLLTPSFFLSFCFVWFVQAAEAHLVHLFEDANLCAIHAKRCVRCCPLHADR